MAIARTLLAEDCKLANGTTRTIPGGVPANADLPSLLPLWEKVASRKFAPDEALGNTSAEAPHPS